MILELIELIQQLKRFIDFKYKLPSGFLVHLSKEDLGI